ncbi:hypothetical protein [Paraburkholderia caribensis]|uniref:hypothetical protein n=1 Tax=Paraburkholderia caribensis TaxID=75105 RepID=UPI001CAD21F8|nr:hypothetical protein [Paraburkholderia caribensis]CAG9249994.1 hypothetical protein PCAR4_260097 [Paraburkholderia caribensis]
MTFNPFGGLIAQVTGHAASECIERESKFAGKAMNAEGVAETWQKSWVRAARLTREGVAVTLPDGTERTYISVREAFRALRLPDTKHIRFRIVLKVERDQVFTWAGREYRFRLIPRADVREG